MINISVTPNRSLMTLVIIAILAALLAACGPAGTPISEPTGAPTSTGFVNLSFEVDGVERTAALYVPPDYDTSKTWPLIVYLHGSDGNGDNAGNAVNQWMDSRPITYAIRNHPERFPALVLIPRCPPGLVWVAIPTGAELSAWIQENVPQNVKGAESHIDAALAAVQARYSVDLERITLTGHSMGGFGTFRYAALHPDRFAAIAPSAGFGAIVPADASVLATIPIWAFQGEKDEIGTPILAQKMIIDIKDAGGDIRYTEYKGKRHAIALRVYNDAELIDWLLNQKRSNDDEG